MTLASIELPASVKAIVSHFIPGQIMGPWILVDDSTGTVLFGRGAVPTTLTRGRNGRGRKLLSEAEDNAPRQGVADQITGKSHQETGICGSTVGSKILG